MNKNIVVILYICTGDYAMFWDEFYTSSSKHFLNEPFVEKKYLVFTDSENISHESSKNVFKIYQKNLGWPNNTLKRYSIFLGQKDFISNSDYVVFFNANTVFNKDISLLEFFGNSKSSLTGCLHPGFYSKKEFEFPLERRKISEAYIPYSKNNIYVMGAINAGTSKLFLDTIEKIDKAISKDEEKNVVAVWHDESHWNKEFNSCTSRNILTPAYLNPENMDIPFEKKIILLDKNRYKDVWKMRGTIANQKNKYIEFVNTFLNSKPSKFVKFVKMIMHKLWD